MRDPSSRRLVQVAFVLMRHPKETKLPRLDKELLRTDKTFTVRSVLFLASLLTVQSRFDAAAFVLCRLSI